MSRIALISPGALGTTVGRTMAHAGHEILCDVSGRSVATRRRAAEAGFTLCGSFREAVLSSEIAVSLVPPGQAVAVSQRFAACLDSSRPQRGANSQRIYVDGNSISPGTAATIYSCIDQRGVEAVDASFFGPANSLGKDNVLVLSGNQAAAVEEFFAGAVEVKIIDGAFGAASATKMSLSILTKALPALFLEAACASAGADQLDAMLELLDRLYPGIMSFIKRTLPTYPRHVARRLDEMREIEAWLGSLGQSAGMTVSGREALAALRLTEVPIESGWSFQRLVAAITEQRASL
jgi:L-threonate 2-dehydrogenase